MKLLTCPVNGPRNITEFQYFGPVSSDDLAAKETLIEHLFFTANPVGVLKEWWRHTPSNTIFIAERHTASDTITATYLAGKSTEGAD